MNKILVLSGTSGSGKSTFARKFAYENENYRIISRDKIRELLFGYNESDIHYYYKLEKFSEYEKEVTTYQTSMIRQILAQGRDVIIDNTNLDTKYIKQIVEAFPQCSFDFKLIERTLEECVEADSNRDRTVGEDVIRKQFKQLNNLKKNFDFKSIPAKNVKSSYNNYFNCNCFIFDLDGTLADNSHRPNYGFDGKLILNDSANAPTVIMLGSLLAQGYKIFFVTGRDKKYYNETKQWIDNLLSYMRDGFYGLEEIEIEYELLMRENDDKRKDFVVKQELYENHIKPNNNVYGAFDDRLGVLSMWNSLGIFTFNVNQTNKEF